MTALQLIAVWAFGPPIEDADRAAVAKARSERVLALSPDERSRLFRLLDPRPPESGGTDRQKGLPEWQH
jgi:hypothetical protein